LRPRQAIHPLPQIGPRHQVQPAVAAPGVEESFGSQVFLVNRLAVGRPAVLAKTPDRALLDLNPVALLQVVGDLCGAISTIKALPHLGGQAGMPGVQLLDGVQEQPRRPESLP